MHKSPVDRIVTDLLDLVEAIKDFAKDIAETQRQQLGIPASQNGLFDTPDSPPEEPLDPVPPHRTRDRRREYLAEKRLVHRVGKHLVLLSTTEVAVILALRDLTIEKGVTTFDGGVERFLDHFEVNEHARGIARERGRHALSALSQPLRSPSANYGDRPVVVMRYPGVGRAVLELSPEFGDAPKRVAAQPNPPT